MQLAQRKGLMFYQTRCNAIIFLRYTPSLLYLESCCDGIWRNHIRESICVTSTTSDDFLHNCMKELDSEVAGSSKDTQRIQPKPKTQLSRTEETRRWTRIHQGDRERYLVWSRGHQALNKNWETRKFGGARHWLQSTRIVTCSRERSRTSPSSRACQKDRKSSSSRSISSGLAAEQRLQPIQQQFEGDDPRIGQCRVIRVVRNFTKGTMFSLFSLLESRNCVRHLRTILGWQRIQREV